jgi:tRNA pseudouridine38-40 synthase
LNMHRYFIDLSYYGGRFSGFQIQANANSIQAEVEKAFSVYFRRPVSLTGASRTDTGVHALQNFFHADFEEIISNDALYHVNAILPYDIVINEVRLVQSFAHCRYDAQARDYKYFLYSKKDPFLFKRAHYFPYKLDIELLNRAASCLLQYSDFSSFSKRNSQVNNYVCEIYHSQWAIEGKCLVFHVRANRFLRGMVRGLVGTMLLVGRNKLTISQFEQIIQTKDPSLVNFSVPGHGLFLIQVSYPDQVFQF